MELQEAIVTSHHTKTFKDKFRGIEYVFKPGEKVQMPLAAAAHVFGVGLEDQSPAWKRLGYTQPEPGIAFLKKFEIKVVNLVPESLEVEDVRSENENLKTVNESLRAQLAELQSLDKKKK